MNIPPFYRDHPATKACNDFLEAASECFPQGRFLRFTSIWMLGNDGHWVHIFTKGTVEKEMEPAQDERDYRNARIVRWSIPIHELPTFLQNLEQPVLTVPPFPDQPIMLSPTASVELLERSEHKTSWNLVELGLPTVKGEPFPDCYHQPFTSRSLPTHEDGRDFVRAQTQCKRLQRNPGWQRGLMIECPDQRGRIDRWYFSDWLAGELTIQTSSEKELIARIDYVAKPDCEGNRGHLYQDGSSHCYWKLRVRAEWKQLSLFAVDADATLLDRVKNLELADLMQLQLNPISQTELNALVTAGETDTVERKSWRVFSKGKEAKETLLKELVAFANTRGGKLLIGIDDAGSPDGPPTHQDESGRVALSDEGNKHARSIRQWIQEEIEPSIEHAIHPTLYQGCQVLVVEVKEGALKPYCKQGGGFYVRDGSRSKPAGHRDMLQLVGRDKRQNAQYE